MPVIHSVNQARQKLPVENMQPYNHDFYSEQAAGSISSSSVVVPILHGLFPSLNSVVDVGCGVGAWLSDFSRLGVKEICGFEGGEVSPEQLMIPASCYNVIDLTSAGLQSAQSAVKYDLALCLEVAEHLPEASAKDFIGYLCSLSDHIAFSAAVPGQGGTNHINEQWLSYWVTIFKTKGYHLNDCIRPLIWNNKRVQWWYRQNIVLFVSEKSQFKYPLNSSHITDIVHPECFSFNVNVRDQINHKLKLARKNSKKNKIFKIKKIKNKLSSVNKFFLNQFPISPKNFKYHNTYRTLPSTHLSNLDINELSSIAQQLPANATCVEIGSYLGASAIIIAKSMPSDAKLYCIDTWMNEGMSEGLKDTYKDFISNISEVQSKIYPIRSKSIAAADRFEGSIDFLFIDGDHSYEGVRADILSWVPKVKPGGIIAFHDIGWAEGVKKAIRELILPIQQGESVILPNFFWTRVEQQHTSKSQNFIKGHVAVISRNSRPSNFQAQKLSSEIEGLPWSWINAGIVREEISLIKNEPMYNIYDSGSVGLLAGRQKAIEVFSNSEVIVYLDDDVSLPSGWAEKIIAPFSDPDIHFVGCRYLPDYAHTPPQWLEDMWSDHAGGFRILSHLSLLDGGHVSRLCSPMLIWGLCFAVRRETLQKLGGFNPDGYPWELRRYRGDGETGLAMKASRLGLAAYYQAQTHVLHAVPAERMTPGYFIQRSYLQGISDAYTAVRDSGFAPASKFNWTKNTAYSIRKYLDKAISNPIVTANRLRKSMKRSYYQGRRYLETEISRDPALLEWVLKSQYGDGSLPGNWQKHLAAGRKGKFNSQ